MDSEPASPPRTPRPPAEQEPGPSILELRIHGIANTPPHGTLGLRRDEVTQTGGDGLGSFWVPTPAAEARGRSLPPGDVHAIRAGVRREAYSWGAMARLGGLPFGGVLGFVGTVAVRLLWAAMVPFGLVNAAYWARRIPAPDPAAHRRTPPAGQAVPGPSLRPEATAALTRVFSLGLTLLFVSAVATVALSVIGTRCIGLATPGPDSVVPVCARIPSALYGLARLDVGDRLALLSLAPVLLVAILVAVAHSGQVRFESKFSVMRAGRTVAPSGPVLHRAGFWSQRSGSGLLWAHLGAALALTGQYLTWTRYADAGLPAPALPVAALVVLLGAGLFVALRTDDDGVQAVTPRWKARAGLAVFAAGLLVWLLACAACLAGPQPETMPALIGLDLVPALLGVGLGGIAATGLAWRTTRGTRGVAAWSAVPVVATACVGVVLVTEPGPGLRYLLVAIALLAVLSPVVVVLAAMVLRRRATEGWNGAGPGVFLLVSVAAGTVYSSLLVLGVQWVLRYGERATTPRPLGDGLVGIDRTVPDPDLVRVPPVYTEFGTTSVVIALVFLVLLGVAAAGPYVIDTLRSRTLWIPGAPRTLGPPYGPAVPAWRAVAEAPDPDGGANPVLERVLRGRQVAAMSHRVELAAGALAAACYVAALFAHIPLLAQHDGTGIVRVPSWLSSLAVPALGVLAVTLVVSALAGASGGVPGRPWGLLWDLMCFLPRSAHPFGPPSYAERVVPEVRSRVDAWLTGADIADDAERARVAPTRRVVLSAHSMGGVLAAAVILIRAGNPVTDTAPDAADGRLGLLTYGVQLRPFFGRFFPELLGPTATGEPPCTGPAWSADPWGGQVRAAAAAAAAEGSGPGAAPAAPLTPEGPEPGSGEQVTLMSLLTCGAKPAWVNLWRRTDFLGFPVLGYGVNEIDRGAEEMDRSAYLFAVATHSGYPASWAYHEALEEVLARLTPAGQSGAQPAVTQRGEPG